MSANPKLNHHSKMEICGKVAIWVPLGPSSLQAPFDEHRVQEATDLQCPSSNATSRHLQAKGSELVSSVSLQFNLQHLEVEERVNFHKSPGLKLISLKYSILPNPHAHTFKKMKLPSFQGVNHCSLGMFHSNCAIVNQIPQKWIRTAVPKIDPQIHCFKAIIVPYVVMKILLLWWHRSRAGPGPKGASDQALSSQVLGTLGTWDGPFSSGE